MTFLGIYMREHLVLDLCRGGGINIGNSADELLDLIQQKHGIVYGCKRVGGGFVILDPDKGGFVYFQNVKRGLP